jgi:hypothetical protein
MVEASSSILDMVELINEVAETDGVALGDRLQLHTVLGGQR